MSLEHHYHTLQNCLLAILYPKIKKGIKSLLHQTHFLSNRNPSLQITSDKNSAIGLKLETTEQRMDSQTQTDAYFTNLLQGESNLLGEFMMKSPNQMGQCSSQHGEVAGQESPLSPQIESTTKKSQRCGNFTTEEDNLLVLAWLNTSLDAVHGNEQKHKTLE
ncbi:uncharacterized protein LOC114302174 [Camellia sinensis]|uniref:uncharacterized protein LOC114302174 n=1 Tax=Camellia sinensis TaxID=4442 RepID=UPI0010362C11|nr:uncharacterized protein LOC114302174 [Camellia sinensis]